VIKVEDHHTRFSVSFYNEAFTLFCLFYVLAVGLKGLLEVQ